MDKTDVLQWLRMSFLVGKQLLDKEALQLLHTWTRFKDVWILGRGVDDPSQTLLQPKSGLQVSLNGNTCLQFWRVVSIGFCDWEEYEVESY